MRNSVANRIGTVARCRVARLRGSSVCAVGAALSPPHPLDDANDGENEQASGGHIVVTHQQHDAQ